MRQISAALLSAASFACVHAGGQVPEGATQAVTAYSQALMDADCERMQTFSAVMHRHPEDKEFVCHAAKAWKDDGMYERLRQATDSLASGSYRMVVVPNSRVMPTDDGAAIVDGVYVVLSGDAGQHWQVLDIACDQLPKWVKGLYPAYDGHPRFKAPEMDRLTAKE